MPKVGEQIPGTDLLYEESDIANLGGQQKPPVQPVGEQPAQPSQPIQQPAPAGTPVLHTVQPKENLSQIAQRFGVSTAQITGYRSGNPNLIFPGEVLNINKLPVVPQEGAKGAEAQPQAPKPATAAPVASGGVPEQPPQAEQPPLPAAAAQPFDFDALFEKFGLSTKNTIEDVVKTVSKLYGFDEINSEMEKLDNDFIEASSDITDNPWLTSSLQDGKVKNLKDRYDRKKEALIDRLKLKGDLIGKAIDVYQAERKFQQDNLFKALDLRKQEIERQKGFELSPGEQRFEINPLTGEYEVVAAVAPSDTLIGRSTELERAFQREFGRLPTASELLQYRPSVLFQTGAMDRLLTPAESGDFGVPYGTKASEVRGLIPLETAQRKQLTTKASALSTLSEIQKISDKVNTFGPGFYGINRLIEGGKLGIGALTQENPDAAQLLSQKGILATIIRGLGEVGTLATADVDRALALIPGLTTTKDVARRNIQEIRDILEASQEAVIAGAQVQLRPGKQDYSGVSPSGLKYKVTQ